jgi:hypothetical protein
MGWRRGLISYEVYLLSRFKWYNIAMNQHFESKQGGVDMRAYEFSSRVTSDGKLVIPDAYTNNIPVGDTVRVIILVNEAQLLADDERDEFEELFSLEEVVDEIKRTPQNPANVHPTSGLLAEHLANSPETPDPSFDVANWNREWDKVEAEMKAMELAEQESEADL